MSYITLPFSWLLNFFYDTFQNYGIAIILFGVLVKLIMLPFQMKSKHSMYAHHCPRAPHEGAGEEIRKQ
jgi:YidC/Oxa1 family membrane protein insertase